jgi:transposase InsO family protein
MITAGTLPHSDQGHQYGSHSYYVLTKKYRLVLSMSRRANCWDNAPIENFFGHLKEEALRQYPTLSFEHKTDPLSTKESVYLTHEALFVSCPPFGVNFITPAFYY